MRRLKGRIAPVTGSASGIGRAFTDLDGGSIAR
jgi:hypothetical protein